MLIFIRGRGLHVLTTDNFAASRCNATIIHGYMATGASTCKHATLPQRLHGYMRARCERAAIKKQARGPRGEEESELASEGGNPKVVISRAPSHTQKSKLGQILINMK